MISRSTLTIVLLVLCTLLLTSCALGVTPLKRAPKNVSEALWSAIEQGDGMTVEFMRLRTDRVITSSQYAIALEQLKTLASAVGAGLDAYNTALSLCLQRETPADACDFSAAQTQLDRADIVLRTLSKMLEEVRQRQTVFTLPDNVVRGITA